MVDPQFDPPRSLPTYAVRKPLLGFLREQAATAHAAYGRTGFSTSAAAGSSTSRSSPPTRRRTSAWIPSTIHEAELKGTVEDLPVEDASFDVVLCSQVLEHCDGQSGPSRASRRVTAPGSRVLATTRRVMPYHPSPTDYWRWTHAGLESSSSEPRVGSRLGYPRWRPPASGCSSRSTSISHFAASASASRRSRSSRRSTPWPWGSTELDEPPAPGPLVSLRTSSRREAQR